MRHTLRVLGEPRAVALAAVCAGVFAGWRLVPFAAVHGGGGLVLLLGAWLVVGLPLVVAESALGSALQGSLPECMRRCLRRAEWLAWAAVATTALLALALVAGGVERLLALLGLPWGGDLGGSRLDGLRVLVLAGAWWGVDRVAAGGLARVANWAARLLAAALVLLVPLVLVAVALPGASLGLVPVLDPGFDVLADPRCWSGAVVLAVVVAGAGCGLTTTLVGIRQRFSDLTSTLVALAAAGLLVQVLLLVAAAALAGHHAWANGVDSVGVLGSHPAVRDQQLAAGLVAAGLPLPLASLALVPGLLLEAALAPVLVLVPALAWRRAGSQADIPVIVIRLSLVGLALGLVSTTTIGGGLAPLLSRGLVAIALPLLAAGLVWAMVAGIGLPALLDHLRAYASIPVGQAWRACLAVIAPLACTGAAAIEVVALLTEPGLGPAWVRVLVGLGPVVCLPLVGWFLVGLRERCSR